jgi:hypothetical protein
MTGEEQQALRKRGLLFFWPPGIGAAASLLIVCCNFMTPGAGCATILRICRLQTGQGCGQLPPSVGRPAPAIRSRDSGRGDSTTAGTPRAPSAAAGACRVHGHVFQSSDLVLA